MHSGSSSSFLPISNVEQQSNELIEGPMLGRRWPMFITRASTVLSSPNQLRLGQATISFQTFIYICCYEVRSLILLFWRLIYLSNVFICVTEVYMSMRADTMMKQ